MSETTTEWKPRAAKCTVPAPVRGVGRFGMFWENAIFGTARVSPEYQGGKWQSATINGAHYWRIALQSRFRVPTAFGDNVLLSGDAFGVYCTLMVCSRGSFEFEGKPAGDWLAENFHKLRDAVIESHPEAQDILRAID